MIYNKNNWDELIGRHFKCLSCIYSIKENDTTYFEMDYVSKNGKPCNDNSFIHNKKDAIRGINEGRYKLLVDTRIIEIW